jgi:hypothetical protein
VTLPSTCGRCLHCGRDELGLAVCRLHVDNLRTRAKSSPPSWCPLMPGEDTPVVAIPLPWPEQRQQRWAADVMRAIQAADREHGCHLLSGQLAPRPMPDGFRYELGFRDEDTGVVPVELVRCK